MTFGEKLQRLRQKAGMSQDALAEQLHVSRQAVSRWERDETMPETDKVVLLADLFGVTTDYLLRQQAEQSSGQAAETADTEKKHDWVDKLAYLAKTKGYLLGWILIVWGAMDLLGVLASVVLSRAFFLDISFVYSLMGGDRSASVTTILTRVFWLPILYGVVKIIVGLLVLKCGKSYAEKVKEEERR